MDDEHQKAQLVQLTNLFSETLKKTFPDWTDYVIMLGVVVENGHLVTRVHSDSTWSMASQIAVSCLQTLGEQYDRSTETKSY